jgi:hypothetical protein
MKLGLTDLIDPRLLPLIDGSRAYYANRAAGRGPYSWEELRAVRANLAPPAGELSVPDATIRLCPSPPMNFADTSSQPGGPTPATPT